MAHDPERSYDAVAEEYARRIFHELDGKPFDRQLLDRFARELQGASVDLSSAMVERARHLIPSLDFTRGDMLHLDGPDGQWAGVLALYSLIHIPREQVVDALHEFKRVLRPEGRLLVSFHIGDKSLHLDEWWWGNPVAVDFALFQPAEMAGYLTVAGFEILESLERDPYAPDIEHQSRRCYISAAGPSLTR